MTAPRVRATSNAKTITELQNGMIEGKTTCGISKLDTILTNIAVCWSAPGPAI
jgi:hypothetical protein